MRKDEYKNIFHHHRTHWWYRGMAAINTSLLKCFISRDKKNIQILDAGCGPGTAFWYLKKLGKVTGVDISPEALRFARKMGIAKRGSVTKLPFGDNMFDVVLCQDVLYHFWVTDYHKALKEFHRVLVGGGILLLHEPAYNWMKGSHDIVDFTERRFQKKDMMKSVERAGFIIYKTTYANFFLFPFILMKRIPEVLIKAKKDEAKSDIAAVQPLVNNIFLQLLYLESRMMKFLNLPFGSTLMIVAKKK